VSIEGAEVIIVLVAWYVYSKAWLSSHANSHDITQTRYDVTPPGNSADAIKKIQDGKSNGKKQKGAPPQEFAGISESQSWLQLWVGGWECVGGWRRKG
jgi:hypothetical protein